MGVGTWLQLDLQLAHWTVLPKEFHLPVQGIQAEGRLQTGEGSPWMGAGGQCRQPEHLGKSEATCPRGSPP